MRKESPDFSVAESGECQLPSLPPLPTLPPLVEPDQFCNPLQYWVVAGFVGESQRFSALVSSGDP